MAKGFFSDVEKSGKIKPHRVESENTNVERGLILECGIRNEEFGMRSEMKSTKADEIPLG